MPGLNQKGPLSEGPLTGGQRGTCTQNDTTVPTSDNKILQQPAGRLRGGAGCRRLGGTGRGIGRGAGMGAGRGAGMGAGRGAGMGRKVNR